MVRTGVTVKDVPAADFVGALAAHFKKSSKMELPKWADLVKTGVHKELAPYDEDWYYVRAASIARRVYLNGGLGVGALQRVYGGSYSKGTRKSHFQPAASGVIRHIMIQLQEIDIVSKRKDKKGRWVTRNGQREMDTIAGQIMLKDSFVPAQEE